MVPRGLLERQKSLGQNQNEDMQLWCVFMTSLKSWIDLHSDLVDLEFEAETKASETLLNSCLPSQLQTRGLALLNLSIVSTHAGVGGRPYVTFSKKPRGFQDQLPPNKFRNGEITGIFSNCASFKDSRVLTGVVHSSDAMKLTVALDADHNPLDGDRVYSLGVVCSNGVHKLYRTSLSLLKSSKTHPVVSACFDGGSATFTNRFNHTNLTPSALLTALNTPQKEAIAHALNAKEIVAIHGPPGTGKTTTLVALITQQLALLPANQALLVSAHSHSAVDALVRALSTAKVTQIVRLGHISRVGEDVRQMSLDTQVDATPAGKVCLQLMAELNRLLRSTRGRVNDQVKQLRFKLRANLEIARFGVLKTARVILSTCTGVSILRDFKQLHIPIVVIDEAAQALEVSSWLPVLILDHCEKLILAGDHKQLAPIVKSMQALSEGFGKTLFSRLLEDQKMARNGFKLLSVQYRMHADIMQWSSEEFYESRLVAHASVAGRTLSQILSAGVVRNPFYVTVAELLKAPLIFVDTARCSRMQEREKANGDYSTYNPGEAALAAVYAKFLFENGLKPLQLAVIAPYTRQVDLVRELLPEQLRASVATVDSFQGGEREVVILSLTRSNNDQTVGFLADERRLNVAVTRAKRQLFIIGDSDTLGSDAVLSSLVSYSHEVGMYLPLSNLLDETVLTIKEPAMRAPVLRYGRR